MAMKNPRPGVIELERDRQITISGQRSNITTRSIDEVEFRGRGNWVKDVLFLSNNPEIVTVEMDWVVESANSNALANWHFFLPLRSRIFK
jgi:hypothetical protein